MNINGLGASSPQIPMGNSSKNTEQEIQKLEQKKIKLQQDKAKASSPFSKSPSKEAAEIDKKIKELDKQIQRLKVKATTSAGGQKNQEVVKNSKSDKNQFDKLTLDNKQADLDEKPLSGVYNVKSDENGSQEIVLTPFKLEKMDMDE